MDHTVEPCLNATVPASSISPVCTFNGANAPLQGWGPAFAHVVPGTSNQIEFGINHPSQGSGQNHLGATVYTDVSGTYHMDSWNSDFTFGIQNLWAKQPPMSVSAFANSYSPFYNRIPGRFFYARMGVKF